MRVFVHADGDTRFAAPRSARRLPGAEIVAERATLAAHLGAADGPVWVLSAGALADGAVVLPPSPRARPLLALGAVALPEGAGFARAPAWARLLADTGGDLDVTALTVASPIASVAVDARLARAWAAALAHQPLVPALTTAARAERARVVRLPELDVAYDERPRVLSIITSLQQGGAERLVVELTAALPARGVAAHVATVGRPLRPTLPLRAGTPPLIDQAGAFGPTTGTPVDLADARRQPAAQAAAALAAASCWGADLLHAHLLGGAELRALAATGVPLVTTVHNARDGWPEGTAALAAGDVALVLACALAVEDELRAAGVRAPLRTVWNAIDERRLATPPDTRARVRRELDVPPHALMLLAIANPRPQKRLERLPAIVGALLARGVDVHLVVVGDQGGQSPAAAASEAAWAEAVAAAGVEVGARLRRLGPCADVGPQLAAADVLVSTSRFEGLSLAQLEARAAGVPLVGTEVGGSAELARGDAGVTLLPAAASAHDFAAAVVAAAARPRQPPPARRFAIAGAAARHAQLYRQLLTPRQAPDARVVLLANNFSVGGAQSSARRLLTGLAARGVAVEAIVLEEDETHPTPGRQALVAAGVPVRALPPSWSPAQAAAEVSSALWRRPPRALVFWNAISEHKLRIADGLCDAVPILDVSPGEMYFDSLERLVASFAGRPDVPLRDARDYGRRLRALVVKYSAERDAALALGAPVHVIANGVPLPPRPARGSDGARLVLGTAARLAPHKRLDLLIDAVRLAARRLPPFELRIAGGGERGQQAHVAELAERARGLPVTWCGALDDVGAFLDGLDLFVMVSEPAGCPNASLEAMAAGLPLVVTDHGGAAEQVTPDVGVVVPRHDAPALAEALLALAHDPPRRRRLAQGARARAQARYGIARMVDDYLALLP